MFDKQIMKKLEGLLNQMSPAQKDKLAGLIKDEESLKQAISHIDPEKAKKVVEDLGVDGAKDVDVDAVLHDFQKNL